MLGSNRRIKMRVDDDDDNDGKKLPIYFFKSNYRQPFRKKRKISSME